MDACEGVTYRSHEKIIVFEESKCPLCEALQKEEHQEEEVDKLELEMLKLEQQIENHVCPYTEDVADDSKPELVK